jgi:branched-chain amino acid transport system permease protein
MSLEPMSYSPSPSSTKKNLGLLLIVGLALAMPQLLDLVGWDYYLGTLTKMMIYGIAACSLNLILGYGGLVSFGHAAYMGIGAYAVGIMITQGQQNAWIDLPLAVLLSALFAFVIGFICLRTKGVYFIMITLAFAQMLYYLSNSIKIFGGDEGLRIKSRLDFGLQLSSKSDVHLYFVVLVFLLLSLYMIYRLMNSKFGQVIKAIKDDDIRVDSIGLHAFKYKLAIFVIAGALGGLAGALMVNQQKYVSPNLLHWTQSGLLMVMVILGGIGTLSGGLWGALLLLTLESVISEYTLHWQFYVGWILLAVILLAPRGLSSLALWLRPYLTKTAKDFRP